MNLPVNTLLQGGKYKIVRFIKSGGFGCTYEAEHVMLEKRIAIKEFFVKDFCNRDEQTSHVTVGTQSKKELVAKLRRKFIDEAKGLCKLHHPGIVSVSDVFEENGTAYFVMDYIEGKSLSEIVHARGALPEKQALDYIRQAGEALQYVHEHNRLHLDIKPDNLMLDGNGQVVLIDFGASKQYDEENGENTSTLIGKTPGYAPLEQMGNDVVRFMPATDVYALGATLYKLLTGTTPLSANRLASGEEQPPLPAGISQGSRMAVDRAMQTRKDKRPQSVREFLSLLGSPAEPSEQENDNTVFEEKTEVFEKPQPEPVRPTSSPDTPSEPEPGKSSGGKSKIRLEIVALIGFALLAIYWGYTALINDMINDMRDREEQTIVESNVGTINGHDYVDLGLPSGLKWATCNVGATRPEEYGDYFAWGETDPMRKETYHLTTYKYWDGKEQKMTKYNNNDTILTLELEDDAAYVNMGAEWRIPTLEEWIELDKHCTWTWTTLNGVKGYQVTGPNGQSIFFPAAGIWKGSTLEREGENGVFMTNKRNESNYNSYYGFGFRSNSTYTFNGGARFYDACTVRAVVR